MVQFSRTPWKESGFNFISQESYKKLRLGYKNHKGEFIPPQLTEGWEFQRLNSRAILYNLDLLESFFKNRQTPDLHLKNIEVYLASLQYSKRASRLSKPPASVTKQGE